MEANFPAADALGEDVAVPVAATTLDESASAVQAHGTVLVDTAVKLGADLHAHSTVLQETGMALAQEVKASDLFGTLDTGLPSEEQTSELVRRGVYLLGLSQQFQDTARGKSLEDDANR